MTAAAPSGAAEPRVLSYSIDHLAASITGNIEKIKSFSKRKITLPKTIFIFRAVLRSR
jgi:hypothetical protein